MIVRTSALALLLTLAGAVMPLRAQEATVIAGRVLRAGTGEPVGDAILRVAGTDVSAVSDPDGRFVLRGVPVGSHILEVRDPERGVHGVTLSVSRPGERFEVVVHSGEDGMTVEVVDAAPAPPAEAEAPPPAGGPATLPRVTVHEDVSAVAVPAPALRGGSLADRAKILQLAGASRNLSDLIRRAFPILNARTTDGSAGDLLCIEFRGAQTRSLSDSNTHGTCNNPQVYLDGVPLMDPAAAYAMTAFDAVQWIQVISPAEAGPQFGGAPYGVILVSTAAGLPGTFPSAASPSLLTRSRRITFDWEQDPAGHPFWRALVFSAVGTAMGLAAGREAWRQCVYVDGGTHELERTCPRPEVAAMGTVAVLLPALGGALGAHVGGRTRASEGRLIPALVGAGLAILPGYGFSLSTVGSGVEATNAVGTVFLVAGTPLFTALADRLYRRLR